MKLLLNEDKDKQYLVLPIAKGKDNTIGLIETTNEMLAEFQLANYFKDPVPHITMASANEEIELFKNDFFEFDVTSIVVQIGKR
jgi:hypothetical protein